MYTCRKGHKSRAGDYCDECGAPIDAAAPAATTPRAPVPSPLRAPVGETAPAGEPCPDCATPRSGRFCEMCGHDFVLAGYAPADAPAGPAASSTDTSPATIPKPTGSA